MLPFFKVFFNRINLTFVKAMEISKTTFFVFLWILALAFWLKPKKRTSLFLHSQNTASYKTTRYFLTNFPKIDNSCSKWSKDCEKRGHFANICQKRKSYKATTIDYCLDFPDKWEFNEAKLPIKLLWWTFVLEREEHCVLKWILVDISCEKMEQHILYLNSSFQILVDAWK